MSASRKLPRSFYLEDTRTVARALLGMHLVHRYRGRRLSGRIVETEAYLGPHDLAAHSARGRTPRTEVMFGPAGHAYVYFIYGFWDCLNVVTRPAGTPQAVLLRALEPLDGLDARTCGPGLLTRALHVGRRLNGIDLTGDTLWIERPAPPAPRVRVRRTPRIGIDYAGAWVAKPWRYLDADSACVSQLSAGERRRLLEKARASGTTRTPRRARSPELRGR
ncbi:MAG: DNA-3-methyladenine glycosylase [Proteobacteria bacterium]|nr:DNA-3-methyladenine glycosylase [Pseudomonadota bacterium]